jgi:hypothetical protein
VSRPAVLIGSIVSALCLGIESAQACTCPRLDAREALSRADGAFIGTLIGRRPGPQPPPVGPTQPIGPAIFTFRVEEAVKGRFGKSVEVWSASIGASCGLEIGVGQRIGLFLSRQEERWTSLLCWQVSPAALRDAARPLPRPDGRGPVRFLVGGGFGGVRLIALDGRGRTLGYGSGGGWTTLLSVCPRGTRAVEVTGAADDRVAIRSLDTLAVIREVSLPLGSNPANVYCGDAGARNVYVFGRRGPGSDGVIFRIRAGEAREIYAGSARSSVFRPGFVYLSERGREIVRLDLNTGVRSPVATAPLDMSHLSLSPDGTLLAGVHWEGSSLLPSRLVVFNLTAPEPEFRSAALDTPWFAGKLVWLGESRLVVFPNRGTGLVFDSRLRRIRRLGGWRATDSIVVSGVAYGVTRPTGIPAVGTGPGQLQFARLPRGPVRQLRSFPSGAGVIAAVPGRVVLRPPRGLFCLAVERVFPGV